MTDYPQHIEVALKKIAKYMDTNDGGGFPIGTVQIEQKNLDLNKETVKQYLIDNKVKPDSQYGYEYNIYQLYTPFCNK